ncbi:hypothetical protein FRC03_006729 [Tulasnella sp. 419]|nr:hypothetical protein FRC03_006729 [Tulasnella sp. 419]
MSTVSKTKPNVTTSSLPQHVNQFSQRHSPLRSPVRSPHPLRHIVQYSPSRSKDAGEDLSRVDVDELFSRFTVSEVRSLKLKLQADADAQQQDLRLMVGERYRDLLEASSAIASISDASKRVKSLLEDVKSACDTTTETRRIQNINRTRSQSVYGVTSVARASGSSQG